MGIEDSLYQTDRIRLAPIDHEKDAVIEAGWTHDAEFLRMLNNGPAIPLSPARLAKLYEKFEKDMDEAKNFFYFTVRLLPQGEETDERLIGFASIYWIEWNHGSGYVQIGIGERRDRACGYGTETLRLLTRYAFDELNLFRLSAVVPAYNQAALRLSAKAGFVEEARRRLAVYRDGQRWDLVHVGLLADEWKRK